MKQAQTYLSYKSFLHILHPSTAQCNAFICLFIFSLGFHAMLGGQWEKYLDPRSRIVNGLCIFIGRNFQSKYGWTFSNFILVSSEMPNHIFFRSRTFDFSFMACRLKCIVHSPLSKNQVAFIPSIHGGNIKAKVFEAFYFSVVTPNYTNWMGLCI